jgi:hypothetical protein
MSPAIRIGGKVVPALISIRVLERGSRPPLGIRGRPRRPGRRVFIDPNKRHLQIVRHGRYTAEAIANRREIEALLRVMKALAMAAVTLRDSCRTSRKSRRTLQQRKPLKP